MAAPDNRIPFAYVPTWLAFTHSKSDAQLRVLVALYAYGAGAQWTPRRITKWSQDIHRTRPTIYRALDALVRHGVLMQRRVAGEVQYRAVLQPDDKSELS